MRLTIVPVVLPLLLLAAAHAAPDLYRLRDLGPGYGYAINTAGDVAGVSGRWGGAFIIPAGGVRTPLPQSALNLLGLTDARHVLGNAPDASGTDAAFAWCWLGAAVTRLTDPGTSRGWDVNNSDQTVGELATDFGPRAFVWAPGGAPRDLGTLGGSMSVAYGTNDAGEVVGMAMNEEDMPRMFRWRPGGNMTDLGAYGGNAFDINDAGQIVGYGSTPAGSGAVIFENGTFRLLPAPRFTPRRINDEAVVIGATSSGRPVVYDAGHGTRYVNSIIDPATKTGISSVTEVAGLNDRGDIVGTAITTDGTHRVIVLQAAPEADTVPPVIVGLAVDPTTLWPPRGDMRPVTVSYTVSDNRDPAPTSRILPITCSQASFVTADAAVVDAHRVQLRAVRDGSDKAGRVYTIRVEAKDAADNVATASAVVIVPHDASPKRSGLASAAVARAAGGGVSIVASVTGLCTVQATVVNMAGVTIRRLPPVAAPGGALTMLWDGRSDRGTQVATGRYLVQVAAVSPDGLKSCVMAPLQLNR